MTAPVPPSASRRRAGFTLLELIGVMSIIAILATILVPNIFRSIELAMIRAETATLDALGEQVKAHLRSRYALPGETAAHWWEDLADFTELSPPELRFNRRHYERLYVIDPTATPIRRVMIVSNLHPRLTLPGVAAIQAEFDTFWDTPTGTLPAHSAWSGWSGWRADPNSADCLLIERINVESLYQTELRRYTVTLNNLGTSDVSYVRYRLDGGTDAAVVIPAGNSASSNWQSSWRSDWWSNWGNWGSWWGNWSNAGTNTGGSSAGPVITDLRPGERLDLCRDRFGQNVAYRYVVSSSHRTFSFDGTAWTSQ